MPRNVDLTPLKQPNTMRMPCLQFTKEMWHITLPFIPAIELYFNENLLQSRNTARALGVYMWVDINHLHLLSAHADAGAFSKNQ